MCISFVIMTKGYVSLFASGVDLTLRSCRVGEPFVVFSAPQFLCGGGDGGSVHTSA